MSPSEALPAPPWSNDSAALAVIAALEAAGGEGCARFVGGCVRNWILGVAIDDLDIATQLSPTAVIGALRDAGLSAVPTGLDHGTVTAICKGRAFEVTTLRRDVSTDGRRAVVAFTVIWAEDAERRDFRLNALYADTQGRLFDPIGHGLEDARAGRIIFVGDPRTRIQEDFLRILRFFRFQAWYGRTEPDQAALEACASLKAGLAGLSAERIAKELLKLLGAAEPGAALRLMQSSGVLGVVLPEAHNLARLEALIALDRLTASPPNAILRLAALLPSDPAMAVQVAARLRLSNAQRDRLAAAAAPFGGVHPEARRMRRIAYESGPIAAGDRVMLAWAALMPERNEPWAALLESARGFEPPTLPISGEDALAFGLAPGRKVGAALKLVEQWWMEQDFQPGRDVLLRQLDRVTKALG